MSEKGKKGERERFLNWRAGAAHSDRGRGREFLKKGAPEKPMTASSPRRAGAAELALAIFVGEEG